MKRKEHRLRMKAMENKPGKALYSFQFTQSDLSITPKDKQYKKKTKICILNKTI